MLNMPMFNETVTLTITMTLKNVYRGKKRKTP